MNYDCVREFSVGSSKITVGRFTYGLESLSIRQWGEGSKLNIGSFCSFADRIQLFLGGNHRVDWITTFPFGHIFREEFGKEEIPGHPSSNGDVNIGNDVWVASGVTIMSGLRIGNGAVLAANAVVTKDVSDYQIVGGNPAKAIRKRFDDETITLLNRLKWWSLPISEIKKIKGVLCSAPNRDSLHRLVASLSRVE